MLRYCMEQASQDFFPISWVQLKTQQKSDIPKFTQKMELTIHSNNHFFECQKCGDKL